MRKVKVLSLIVIFLMQFAFLFWMIRERLSVISSKDSQVVWLEARPVDPFDYLSGHYMVVSPVISEKSSFKSIVGDTDQTRGVFAKLRMSPKEISHPDTLYADRESVPKDALFLSGELDRNGRIKYGIEEFFCNEADRNELNKLLSGRTQFQMAVTTIQNWRGRDMSIPAVLSFASEFDETTSAGASQLTDLDLPTSGGVPSSYYSADMVKRQRLEALRTLTTSKGPEFTQSPYLRVRVGSDGTGLLEGMRFGERVFLSKLARQNDGR